jgi:pyruvate/2-oxoglutarate dehydrogenase complex dihydrolipoamide acyltransferase (E2) component
VAYEFKLPDLGEGLTEGEIARWLVAEGQEIAEDDPLVEIQTDKTTVEIPSPAAGVVSKLFAAEGDVVPVGTVIVAIADGAGAPAVEDVPEQPPVEAADVPGPAASRDLVPRQGGDGRVRATPLVRRLAEELGVELESVEGTGPQGRVTEADVRAVATITDQVPRHGSEGRRERLRGVRRVIAEHMTRAQSIPAVTWVEECDFGNVDLKRLVPTVLEAVAASLQEYPELNARLEDDEVVFLERYDLGVAIDTEQGLVVPVVRDCDSRSLDELDAEVARLAEAARAGTLKPEELRGSTFTVTSAGKFSGSFVTPLINDPEVGILGIHRIAERPVVRDGQIVARPIGHVSVTFDHRVLDGKRAAEFGLDVISRLERERPG